jgi:hypothetical protein
MFVLVDCTKKDVVKKSDLVGCLIKEDKQAYLGFYDSDFGIICLDIPNSEPLIFDENEVESFGKVIGYGLPEKNFSNRETVKITALK